MFDLPAYLTRLDLPARPTDDAAGLQRLQRSHRLAIPFENCDVALGRPIAIDGASVFAKLVRDRRGGYCFEHNRLFGDALSALGFAHRALIARVWLGVADGGEPPCANHTLSLVTIAGQPWIADAGFGGSYAPAMPLVDGAEADAPDGARFRLSQEDGRWTLWRDGPAATTDGRSAGPGWRRQYDFTLAAVGDDELVAANAWTQTSPDSRQRRVRIASIVLPHGFASLTGREYRRRAGDKEAAGTIDDPRVYRMRLSLMFGIDLSAEDAGRVFEMAG